MTSSQFDLPLKWQLFHVDDVDVYMFVFINAELSINTSSWRDNIFWSSSRFLIRLSSELFNFHINDCLMTRGKTMVEKDIGEDADDLRLSQCQDPTQRRREGP